MREPNGADLHHRRVLARFWVSAAGFWSGRSAWRVWLLCALLIAIVVGELITNYWLNYWNRDFFNALEGRNASALGHTMLLFFPLAALSTTLAVTSVWARMTTQRKWRQYLSRHLIKNWLAHGHYRSLGHLNGTDSPQNAEFRIAEDARVATDAPVDLVLSLLSSILTVFVFFEVLSNVGGAITIPVAGAQVTIPAYLAIAVVTYSTVVTGAMLLVGRQLSSVVQDQLQAEASFRASANLIRETGEGMVVRKTEAEERRSLWVGLNNVIEQWRRLCCQLMRITFVTHTNILLAPTVGLLLCIPKYLEGQISLGEVTQAAAAFATVQGAFNWMVDNFHRMADWRSSATRVAVLLMAIDDLKQADAKSTLQFRDRCSMPAGAAAAVPPG
jgi:ABC-type uncharacterized transport system fused permease/ATPase subunit